MNCCRECAARDRVEGELEVIGRDTRVRVLDTTVEPFRYICNLEYNGRPLCSGTLIGPRTVLTAGHCVSGFDAKKMRIIPGRNGTLEPLPATRATTVIPYPRYAPATETDIGIIHLADPIGSTVGHWKSILSGALPLPPDRLPVNISGYPGDKPGGGTFQWRSFNLAMRRIGRMLHHLADSYPGHSGSPVWVRRDPSLGGRILIAVHVAGDDPSVRGKANRAVLIDATVRRWIAANTK
ncbi:MAG TPA: trypsin-like serine protease [Thermoanaerobaculia bacterium]|nr:trypsin-like serine protease [Thermoanaerobaculia bacterium]